MELIEYGQGATIAFFIEGDTTNNLDDNNFEIQFISAKNVTFKKLLKKGDANVVFVSENKYRCEISNLESKTMPVGIYKFEILFGSEKTAIARGNAFEIFGTQIKSEVV